MGHQKINPGLSSFSAKELGMLGIPSELHKGIVERTNPEAYLSSDKFCLYIKAGSSFDIMGKSATGKSETKIGTRISPAIAVDLKPKHLYDQMRVLVELNPELAKLGPVSYPKVLEPGAGEGIGVTLWKLSGSAELPDLSTLPYLYRLYMFT